jgi:hypothetical protein
MSRQKPTSEKSSPSAITLKSDLAFRVVGIGASAGGVAALQAFSKMRRAVWICLRHRAPSGAQARQSRG